MLGDLTGGLYRALNRLPRVLATDDPWRSSVWVRALGRPDAMQLVLGSLLAIVLLGQPAAALFLPPARAIGGMVYMLANMA